MDRDNWLVFAEIPLACLSFIFAKINKFVIGNIYTIYLYFQQKKTKQWRVIDNELVKSNLNMAVLMTKAPRWNTHAIIGTLGPISIKNSLSIELKSANNSTKSWIAIFYSFPSYKTISSLNSNQADPEKNWYSVPLKSGKYTIGLRYYNYINSGTNRDNIGINLTFPAIIIDEKESLSSKEIYSNSNDFYHNLIERKNLYFLFIHYYIYTILRLRKYLPESFIQREFLPVGATDTKFFYDYLDENESLQIEIEPLNLRKYDIYLTLYDRCSLPVSWCQLTKNQYQTIPLNNKGYYLIRVRSLENNPQFADLNLKVERISEK